MTELNLSFTKPSSFTFSQSPLKWLDYQHSLTQHKLKCVHGLKPWINEWDSEEMVLKVTLCISVFQVLTDDYHVKLYVWTVFIAWYHCTITFFRARITDTHFSGLQSSVIFIKRLSRLIISSTSFSSLSDNTSSWHSSWHSCPLRQSRCQAAAPDTT